MFVYADDERRLGRLFLGNYVILKNNVTIKLKVIHSRH